MTEEQENADSRASHEAVRTHIEQTIQEGLQLIRDFLSHSADISVEVVQESKYNSDIHNVLIKTASEPKPLCFLTLFELDRQSSEDVADQLRMFLVACGYEVINPDNSHWDVPSQMSDAASKIFNFMSSPGDIHVSSEYEKTEDDAKWNIRLSLGENQVDILELRKMSNRSVAVIERQIAMLIGAMDRTVQTSDGTRLNIYGCIVSPLDV
tara:strand:+ start:11991 stop:12620 length:630 start_codon:yes stop_codon:yes gene_type:complete